MIILDLHAGTEIILDLHAGTEEVELVLDAAPAPLVEAEKLGRRVFLAVMKG
ncbi:MAG: hypothetical protein M3Q92_02260 [Actinomycetota bacterium]|nr:hypothetical protein [Actinomycetota bacterium]